MQSISQILKEERTKKGLTLGDVEKQTRIRREFLEAIEDGDFGKLPSESYAMGFVKTYAKLLELPEARTAALFRREYYANEKLEVVPGFRKTQNKIRRSKLLSPRGYLIAAVGVVILIYVFFQFSSLLFGPKLTVERPRQNQTVSTSVVEVKGTTDQFATVQVDREDVYVDIAGSFGKTVFVYPGNQKITVIAKNRYGKETRKIIDITVK